MAGTFEEWQRLSRTNSLEEFEDLVAQLSDKEAVKVNTCWLHRICPKSCKRREE